MKLRSRMTVLALGAMALLLVLAVAVGCCCNSSARYWSAMR